jgi:hypothetical protein
LAALLHKTGEPGAKRHVLQALEEAPRFRDAHRLLLRVAEKAPAEPSKAEAPEALPAVEQNHHQPAGFE